MKRVLITGAGSYIGNNVEAWLKKWPEQYQVEVLDMQLPTWKEYDFSSFDSVFHVAGIAHADVGNVSEERKQFYYKINTDLAIETAKVAKYQGVKQFILMSSMIIYGGKEHVSRDTMPDPANFYGDSKWRADQGIRELEDDTFKVVVLRPPMIYGKNSKGNYPVLAKMAKKLPIFPRINNKRSVLFVDNLSEFVRLMIENEESGIFFPQNESLVSTADLVGNIAKAHNHKIWMTSLLNPFVAIAKRIPGKIGNLASKAFGSSYYDMEMSQYKDDYIVITSEESIVITER